MTTGSMTTGSPAGSLRDSIRRRLDYLRAGGEELPPFALDDHDDGYLPERLGADWQRLAPYVHRRVAIVPSPLTDRPRLLPESVPIERCAFFDTETTGLAGAGAVIFLFGIATVRGDRMVVEQVFLEDFPGETAFLEHVERLLAEHRLFVSFNGKAFDKTILTTRFLMDGRSLNMPEHLDLLYPSRRLWASITVDCRLKTLEEEILGIDRGEDIDGFEVPASWDLLRPWRSFPQALAGDDAASSDLAAGADLCSSFPAAPRWAQPPRRRAVARGRAARPRGAAGQVLATIDCRRSAASGATTTTCAPVRRPATAV